MAAGFESYNPDGTLQFSTQTNAFYFLQKGSFNYIENSFLGLVLGTVDGLLPFDFVVFASDDKFIYPSSFRGASEGQIFLGEVGSGVDTTYTVNYWTFKSMKYLPPRSTGVGIEIYDETGAVSFTDQYVPLRIVQKVPITSQPVSPVSYSLPVGRTYAFGYYGVSNSSGVYPGVKRDGSNFSVAPVLPLLPTGGLTGYNGGLIAVDVTGY